MGSRSCWKSSQTLPQLQDVTGDLQATAPRLMLKLDRDVIGRFGLSPQLIDDTLYDAFGQRQVATVFGQLDQRRVILEVEPGFQEDASTLQSLYVRTANGQLVPMSVLIKQELSVSPLTINHTDQFPSVTLSFNLAPGYSLGDALTAIRNLERTLAKPATLTARFQGSAKVFETSLATQPYLIAAAIIAVYIVLGILYESFIHPITILSTLPSAGVGAFLALMVLHYDFSLIALIGVILLVGIVKKNAIMMIDFALVAERSRHLTRGAIDLRGLPAALPPDHDDDHGGPAGRPSAGARHRRRLGAAPPARHRHRRRPAAVAVPDAVHDPGRLHLPQQIRGVGAAGTRRGERARSGRCASRRRAPRGGVTGRMPLPLQSF